ncbi:hypothetical protein D5125_16985 [Magnetovirga frankeli]|uniref:hypothetical protein n=1 Tax=Magnetovirga frankeli TaxID=947516 RepID=UPI001293F626|nr:hypothetical protein D5125_16985 [gamma proteobacterium SS-5]
MEWLWSSTPAHFKGEDDGLVVVKPLLDRVEQRGDFLDVTPNAELETALTKGQSIVRPLTGDQALEELEKKLGHLLRPGKRVRPSSPWKEDQQHKLV